MANPFRYIVAKDGSGDFTTIQAAINACPDGERSIIFVKNGTYSEQVTLGTKTSASTKKISLIGESTQGVLITHSQSRASSGSPTYEDICTVKLYATDFYAENISIQNAAGNTGMAEALYTAGDRQTFKNCRILGYQDTYRSKKGTRGYFKNCLIEGAVDFIYAGGTLFFDDCQINCVSGGGYITAPEDAYVSIPAVSTACGKIIRIGFFFRNCNITANPDVAVNTFTLGRPWNTNAGCFYLNCTLGNHIKSMGWTTMSGNETTACFAEYNSKDVNGNLIDVTGRVNWSFQLPKADVDNLLTPEGIYARVSSTVYDPVTLCNSSPTPENVVLNGNTLTWNAINNIKGYLIFKNDNYLGCSDNNSFTDQSGTTGQYAIYTISNDGVLSVASSPVTGIDVVKENVVTIAQVNNRLIFSEPLKVEIFNLEGKIVFKSMNLLETTEISFLHKGLYILNLENKENRTTKIKYLIN